MISVILINFVSYEIQYFYINAYKYKKNRYKEFEVKQC